MNIEYIPDYDLSVTYKYHPIYTNYIVGDNGCIYSTMGPMLNNGMRKPRIPYLKIKPLLNHENYCYMSIRFNGKFFRISFHRMVLETFVGFRENDKQAAHNNGNPSDNRLINLRWVTATENGIDKRIHGTAKGINNSGSKLTPEQVKEIRNFVAYRGYKPFLSQKYNVSRDLIKKIRRKAVWKHLT